MLDTSMQECCGHAKREEVAQLRDQLLELQVPSWACCADNPIPVTSSTSYHDIPWNMSLSGKVVGSRATGGRAPVGESRQKCAFLRSELEVKVLRWLASFHG